MKRDEYATAVRASIEDVADRTARVDTQVRAVLGEVMAQRRSACVALDYVAALSPSTRANCWSLAESAGHEGWGRMQALLGSYRWDWRDLRTRLARLATAWIPDRDGDLIGPGIAIDETARQVAHAHHATINDVVLAAVAGGLRRLAREIRRARHGLT